MDTPNRPSPPKVVAVEHRDADLLPALRQIFDRARWELRAVGDLKEWAATQPSTALLIRVREEADWRRLESLTSVSGAIVVALLARPTPAFYRRAFHAGASAVAATTDSPTHIARVLHAATLQYALVPLAALREPRAEPQALLTETDQQLLQGLADGLTTEQLAERVGCSERTVYRRLRSVCNNLQVRSRREAVSVALRLGLLNTQLVSR